jgi:RNA polymerase sigma factor (sigma-70 family)
MDLPDPDDHSASETVAKRRAAEDGPGPRQERVDRGVVAKFTDFYKSAVPRLVTFLAWHGAPLPDACDCVQDTMIAAFQQWPTLRDPYAWCRTVASRRYARHLATVHEEPTGDLEPASGHSLGADHELRAVEERHAVLRALARLPLRQRQVMAWTFDGATPTEIADNLAIKPAAVRSNLYKARSALRRYLDETGGELP